MGWEREIEPDRFFFRHQVDPKSGNTHFLVMSTSVVRRALRRGVARFVSPRRFHTEQRPLETPEDWTDFQLERANYKRLSEYATTAFTAFAHPARSRPLLHLWLDTDEGEYFPATPWPPPSPRSLTTLPVRSPCLWRTLWTLQVSHEPKLYAIRIRRASRNHRH